MIKSVASKLVLLLVQAAPIPEGQFHPSIVLFFKLLLSFINVEINIENVDKMIKIEQLRTRWMQKIDVGGKRASSWPSSILEVDRVKVCL